MSVVFGFILLLAVTFAIPDTQGVLDAVGNAVIYIWTESMSQTLGGVPALHRRASAQMFCLTRLGRRRRRG